MVKDKKSRSPTNEVVRRCNETIAIAPKNGRITLVTRRLFNVMLYCSQLDGPQDSYHRTLGEIADLADFTSNNTELLKDHLRAMQGNQVEWHSQTDDQTSWGVSGMIAQAEIVEQRGGCTNIIWSLPPKIRDRLLDPIFYTRLSLQIHSSLRSGASIALYEICSRYSTNPSGVTMRAHWDWWRPVLTGNPEPETNNEYKYFKRDVLKPAIAEINVLGDITIELLEFKNGKRIEEIQFKVKRKAAPALETVVKPFDGDLLESIIRLGIPQGQARVFYAEHDSEFLCKTVALTEQRAIAPNVAPLTSKAAYFRHAIKGRYADAEAVKTSTATVIKKITTVVESPGTNKEKIMAAFSAHRHAQAYGHYMELDAEEQTIQRDAFRQQTTVTQYKDEIKRRSLTSPAVRSAFCDWHAQRLWGDSTDADVLAFMMNEKK